MNNNQMLNMGVGMNMNAHNSLVHDLHAHSDKDFSNTSDSNVPPGLSHNANGLPEQFGISGLLSLITRTSSDLAALSLGMELHSLGVQSKPDEPLYPSLKNPCSEDPLFANPTYPLPQAYYSRPAVLKTSHVSAYSDEILFYIIYNMPHDPLQPLAAKELYHRGWTLDKETMTWTTPPSEQILQSARLTPESGHGVVTVFDPTQWKMKLVKPHGPLAKVATIDELASSK